MNENNVLNRSVLTELLKNDNMDASHAKELIEQIKNILLNHNYYEDKNFIMNSRRKIMVSEIEDRLSNKDGDKNQIIKDSLWNFFEFIADEYPGDPIIICQELGITIKEFDAMDLEYRRKGIISLQEKEIIMKMITEFENYISNL